MKVLYLSYDGMTDPLGQSQVIPYLIGLAKKGHEITIISCEKRNIFQKQKNQIGEILSSAKINWIPVFYSSLPSVLSKQLNLLRIKQKAQEFCYKNKPEVVHCRSYMAALIGLNLKKKFGTKFIFDMRGFWANERIDGKIWSLNNILHKRIYNYFKKKEIEFLINADCTISLTQNAKDEILSWKQIKNKLIAIKIIPCCADLELFSLKKIDLSIKESLKNKLQIHSTDFIISYLGSIGTWYMLDEMLDFFKCLSLQKTNAKFLFITPDEKNLIVSAAEAKGISKNKIIICSANRNEVPLYLSLSDISIYFIKSVYSKKASSPTKTGEIMALGIPIITNEGIGDSDTIISDSGSGMLVHKFTTDEYCRIIGQINVLLGVHKETIISAAQKYFSLEKGINAYDSVYKSLA